MQGIGFLDDLSDDRVAELDRAIRQKLAQTPTPVVTFHRPVVRPEAIYLPALPSEPVAAVRNAVRAVIGDVLGPDSVELAPEHVQGYRPHVSIAYSNTAQPAEPIAAALAQVEAAPVKVALHQVALLEFHRDNRMYEWTRSEQVRIGY